MSNKKLIEYPKCISAERAKKLSTLSDKDRERALSGVGQGIKFECAPAYEAGDCETWFRSKGGNAFLILGRDRPNGLHSGYGGSDGEKGDHPAASAVRLTAGMGGRSPKEIVNVHGVELVNTLDPNNQEDAATIYLSQKTDIDDKQRGFNLAKGTIGRVEARSAAAIKADSVRIISRDGGIKLIAGGSTKNSQGGKIDTYPDINFIAGNDDSGRLLQPLVKGDNMKKAIIKLYKYLDEILITVNSILIEQDLLNKILSTHQHLLPPITLPPMKIQGYGVGGNSGGIVKSTLLASTVPPSPFPMGLGTPSPGWTLFSPEVMTQANVCSMNQMSISMDKIVKLKANMLGSKANAIYPTSPNYIMSKNVFTT